MHLKAAAVSVFDVKPKYKKSVIVDRLESIEKSVDLRFNKEVKKYINDYLRRGKRGTELIIGKGSTANKAVSLDLGCVSFREKYFADKKLSSQNFTSAIKAACHIITAVRADFIALGWQSVVGSSGTIQALTEILSYRNQSIVITPDFLQEIKQALIECKSIDHVILEGLRADRTPVLASGLCILIALFDCLEIKELRLSTGALREGLLHKLLPI